VSASEPEKKDQAARTSSTKAGLVPVGGVGGELVPSRWVAFLVDWAWDIPGYGGRATKHFKAGTEILLTRRQHQSATAAGVVVSIQNPRAARAQEADNV